MTHTTLSRRNFLGGALGTAAWLRGADANAKPNFVFILADDLGIDGLSCYGSDQFKTPHIDALAAGGLRYTNAYTAPLCGPSRALIMTGRYAFRTGATNQDATGQIKPEVETFLPKVLAPAGYKSACVGKWGQLPLGPAEAGFDEYLQFRGSGSYWNSQEKARKYTVNGKSLPLGDGQYLPDVMHDFVADYLERHRRQPFCLYYSLSHVHGEILPTPDSPKDSQDLYGDNIRYMDKLMGKLVAALDRLKMRENTVIVFVGDNGTAGGPAERATVNGRRLSGEKGSMQECGALVPLIVNWKGTTPAGKVTAALTDSTDFLPTLTELAGAPLPAGKVIDGRSLAAQWRGKRAARPRDWIYIQLARQWYVRDDKWKLNQKGELFDMSRAPFEEVLVTSDSKEAAAGRKKLQAALSQLNPGGGILDQGDGTGRHANRAGKKK